MKDICIIGWRWHLKAPVDLLQLRLRTLILKMLTKIRLDLFLLWTISKAFLVNTIAKNSKAVMGRKNIHLLWGRRTEGSTHTSHLFRFWESWSVLVWWGISFWCSLLSTYLLSPLHHRLLRSFAHRLKKLLLLLSIHKRRIRVLRGGWIPNLLLWLSVHLFNDQNLITKTLKN